MRKSLIVSLGKLNFLFLCSTELDELIEFLEKKKALPNVNVYTKLSGNLISYSQILIH